MNRTALLALVGTVAVVFGLVLGLMSVTTQHVSQYGRVGTVECGSSWHPVDSDANVADNIDLMYGPTAGTGERPMRAACERGRDLSGGFSWAALVLAGLAFVAAGVLSARRRVPDPVG